MQKQDVIGLYEILCNILEDEPKESKCSNKEKTVYAEIKNLKKAIDNL